MNPYIEAMLELLAKGIYLRYELNNEECNELEKIAEIKKITEKKEEDKFEYKKEIVFSYNNKLLLFKYIKSFTSNNKTCIVTTNI
ncbi:hypothetical protein AFV9_gp17 [Betalipothrixvirus uzonense]|uniref:Uncharacterized protein n=1 Tax=Betalipothrixvirus uzonense TaxID=512792 RepID=B2CRJ4_9VIRU|nr:hypothetical protein AFV9_gp17 [Acidianus filamentous virus 9]ACB37251.1 hypothetical protein [Acidianus filamentous virus 9]